MVKNAPAANAPPGKAAHPRPHRNTAAKQATAATTKKASSGSTRTQCISITYCAAVPSTSTVHQAIGRSRSIRASAQEAAKVPMEHNATNMRAPPMNPSAGANPVPSRPHKMKNKGGFSTNASPARRGTTQSPLWIRVWLTQASRGSSGVHRSCPTMPSRQTASNKMAAQTGMWKVSSVMATYLAIPSGSMQARKPWEALPTVSIRKFDLESLASGAHDAPSFMYATRI